MARVCVLPGEHEAASRRRFPPAHDRRTVTSVQHDAPAQRFPVGDRVALIVIAGLILVQAFVTGGTTGSDATRAFDVGGLLLLGGAFGAVLVALRAPATAALVSLGLTIAWHVMGYEDSYINAPHLFVLYLLGATGDRRRQLGVGAIVVGLPALAIGLGEENTLGEATAAVGWTVAALMFGELTHSRRALIGQYEARAERAEAEREAEAERRVTQARLEIARDLHDVLAHTVSVMTVQAGVGQDALGRDPATARRALAAIRSAGREATDEIRALVAVLRSGDGRTTTAPAPGLDDIDELVEGTRAAGFDVAVRVDDDVSRSSDIAQLTAFRVVQESLTNVVRHSQAEHVCVELRVVGPDLVVEVDDNGAGAPPTPPAVGHGLRGMRERVETLGGRLEAGPGPRGGWTVRAIVPRDRRSAG